MSRANPVTPTKSLKVYQYFKETGCTYRELSEIFGVTQSEARKITSQHLNYEAFIKDQATRQIKDTIADIDQLNGSERPVLFDFPVELIQMTNN